MPAARLTPSLVVLLLAVAAHGQTPGAPPARTDVDPTTSLTSRIGDTDPSVLRMFADAGLAAPTRHVPTEVERQSLERAFATLPPVHQRMLRERLRRISFLDGMPNTALTSIVEPEGPVPTYDLTIRAGVLRETVSEFLTTKVVGLQDVGGADVASRVGSGDFEPHAWRRNG